MHKNTKYACVYYTHTDTHRDTLWNTHNIVIIVVVAVVAFAIVTTATATATGADNL